MVAPVLDGTAITDVRSTEHGGHPLVLLAFERFLQQQSLLNGMSLCRTGRR